MPPFIYGILYGLIFLFGFGPAFFALFQTSIEQGPKKAVFFALGISISDWIVLLLTLYGFTKLSDNEQTEFYLGLFGGCILLVFAIVSWFTKPKRSTGSVARRDYLVLYTLRGLVLNGINPFIIITWATWVSVVKVNFNFDYAQQLQFFVAMLITILTLDITKAILASKLKPLITDRFLIIMNKSVAIILLVFAARVIYQIL